MSVGALLIILLPLAWEANAAQVPATKELFPSEILLQKTEHFLRWQAFWEGVDSFGGRYRPLAQVKIMIVRSREQAAVFLSDLGLSVTFSEGTDGALLARYGEWRSGDTNESAARRYIRSTAGQPPNRDCVALSPAQTQYATGNDPSAEAYLCREYCGATVCSGRAGFYSSWVETSGVR